VANTDPESKSRDENPKIETIDALYHQAFDVLTPVVRRSFDEFVVINTHARKVGELTLQFCIEEDPTKLSAPDNVNWAAFLYDFVRTDEGLILSTTGMYAEPGPRDIGCTRSQPTTNSCSPVA
jgi:hypothetical protein